VGLVSSKEIVRDAAQKGYAISAINCQGGQYDIVRSIMETATEERSPIILMAYEANTAYYGLEWLPRLVSILVEQFDIPAAVHLDHGSTAEMVEKAVGSGFTSVMIDYSQKPLEQNINVTNRVITLARPKGVSVEAEIGELQRNQNSDEGDNLVPAEPKNLVDPEHVRLFLEAVDIDMLAVGIGNAHGFYKGEPQIRTDLLKEVKIIARDTPLVLHGSTGIPEAVVKECIQIGIAKINYGTIVRHKFLKYMREGIELEHEHKSHIWRLSRYAKERLKEDIRSIIRVTGSNNRL